jgi:sulfur carrier protein
MRVKINGKQEDTTAGTMMELLQSKGIEPQMVSVELNSKVLERGAYGQTKIQDGDLIEFLFFMGGGK